MKGEDILLILFFLERVILSVRFRNAGMYGIPDWRLVWF